MRVAIRADGGPQIGIGHLTRSGVLAQKCLEEGHEVTYLTTTTETVADVCPSGIEIRELNNQKSTGDVISWIETEDIETVVSDCYEVDTKTQKAISSVANCFTVIQVDDRHELCCDILVNGHLFGPEIDYQWHGTEPIWCTGTDYLLLQQKFRVLANQSHKWRVEPEKALITMGGSDVRNITPVAIRAFDDIDIEVDIIIGPGFDNRNEITEAMCETDCQFDFVEDPGDLPERMVDADFAVSGFGTTVYELIVAGTPFVGIPVVENQRRTARAFESRKLAEVANTEADLQRNVHKLYEKTELRQNLLSKYESLIDGNGVERIFDRIRMVSNS